MTPAGRSKLQLSWKIPAHAFTVLWLGSCAELPILEHNVCGNGVIEPGEQCDLFEDSLLGPGIRCADSTDTLRACRYVCSLTDPVVPCPLAWGCGEDGVCHFASGEYEETETSPVNLGSFTDLHLRDVDGDRQSDLVSASPLGVAVHFGKRDGSFSSPFEFNVQNRSKAIALGDLDEDGKVDLVVPTGIGPIVLRGQRGGTLSPVIYPQFTPDGSAVPGEEEPIWLQLLPIATSSCGMSGTGTVFSLLSASEQGLYLTIPGSDGSSPSLSVPGYRGPASVPQRVLAADLDGDGGDEVIVALPGESLVRVYRLRCVEPQGRFEEVAAIRIPAPIVLLPSRSRVTPFQDGVRVADVEGDGDLDILVSVEDETSPTKVGVVILETSREAITPSSIDERFAGLDFATTGIDPGAIGSGFFDPGVAQAWPIAAGDLNGDGRADYLGTGGVYLARRSGDGFDLVRPPAILPHWSEAVIADLNRDGWNDIAAVSDRTDSPGIELFISNVSGVGVVPAFLRPPILIGTIGTPSVLRLGDFDGDLIGDLAFLEAGLLSEVSLSVLFGGTFTRVAMGSPAGLVGMEAARFFSEATDLMTVHRERVGDREEWSGGVLVGTRERRLLSPVPIQGDGLFFPATRVLIGRFDDTPSPDLLALDSQGFLLASGKGGAQFDSDGNQVFFGQFLPGISGFVPDCLLFAGADIDDRPADEELIAAAAPGCFVPDFATEPQGQGGGFDPPVGGGASMGSGGGQTSVSGLDALKAYLFVFGEKPRSELPGVARFELPSGVEEVTGLSIDDLDRSGRPEILVAYGVASLRRPPDGRSRPGGSAAASGEGSTSGVLILWNVRASFDGEPVLGFESSSTVVVGDGLSVPRAIASLNADDDEARELAVLVHGVDPQDPSRTLALTFVVDFRSPTSFEHPEHPVIQNPLEALGKPQLVASDVDRDGLDDLVFGDGAQVTIYRAIPDGRGGADRR